MFAVGHLALGYLTGKTASRLLDVRINVPLLFLASILPDIDLILGMNHRGPTHSIFMYAAAIMPVLLLYGKQVVPFFAALAQHSLFGDLLTGGGVQVLWPVVYERFGVRLQITGAPNVSLEWVAFLSCIALLWRTRDAMSLFHHHPSNLLLVIPVAAILLPAFLGFPMAISVALIVPHLVFLVILALSMAADLKQISRSNTRKESASFPDR